jgi:hypothetical protein
MFIDAEAGGAGGGGAGVVGGGGAGVVGTWAEATAGRTSARDATMRGRALFTDGNPFMGRAAFRGDDQPAIRVLPNYSYPYAA